MNEFIHYIKSYVDIEPKDLQVILSYFKERSVARNKFILRQGKIASDYFFVVSGGCRIFYGHQGVQTTAWVALENTFFTDLESQKKQIPSKFNIQAIENTVILSITQENMEMLYRRFPLWQEFGRKVWEDAFVQVVEGAMRFQSMTAEERYLAEMKQSAFLKRIPLKQLASYLGITPTSLSRLRKKIR